MSTGLIDGALNYVADHAWKGYGTSVNITSYSSSSNQFTVPSDGIIRLMTAANGYVTVTIDGVQVNAHGSGYDIRIPVQVFKGQKFHVTTSGGASVYYTPYVNHGGGYKLINFPYTFLEGRCAA